jgi:hypothetical protein
MSVPHLLALGSLAAAFVLGGYATERLCFRHAPLGHLRWLARVVLGVLLWMAVLFALAAGGALSTASVLAFAAACVTGAGLARAFFGTAGGGEASGAGFALAAALLSSPFLVLALRPEVSWDASSYHLTVPKHWLASGGFAPLPFSVYAHWPLATELLYAAAMALQDHTVAKALHWAFGLATLWTLYLGARTFHRRETGWIAAPLALANPVLLFELGVAYADLAYAFFFSAGLLFALQWRRSGGEGRSSLWLTGLCCGGLAGLKVTGIVGAAALAALAAPRIATRLRAGAARAAGRDLLALGLPVLLLWGPWLAKSALLTGNPVYPLLYEVFGGPDWSPTLSRRLVAWLSSIGMGREPLDYVLLPLRVIVSGGPSYHQFGGRIGGHWLLLVPLAIALGRGPLARGALAASAVYFALWALSSQQMRFLIPLLGPLALASAVAIGELMERLPSARARRAALAAVLAGGTLLYAHTARLPLRSAWQALRQPPADPRSSADRFVATLPPQAKLLVLNTNQGFFLERPYLADSFFEASQIADWLARETRPEGVRARLRERGVTHVLVERRDRGVDWPPALTDLLADRTLLARRFRSADGRFELFELR